MTIYDTVILVVDGQHLFGFCLCMAICSTLSAPLRT